MTSEQPTDEVLWCALKQGNRLAFSELYQRYHRPLYNYGYKLFPQVASVEDAVQDLFVDIWRMRQNLSDAESVKFYLFRSLRRQIYRLSEKDKRLLDLPFLPATHQAADQQLIDLEKEEQLTQQSTHLLQQLPQRQLEVITLRFYENFNTHEIADIMGITDKSVRNTLHKALTHLREHSQDLALILSLLLLASSH